MLNGLDPIIIFQFKKLLPNLFDQIDPKTIPVVADESLSFPLPFIPIYLSEKLTGVFISSESKNVDVDTTVDTASNGSREKMNQRGISSTVKIEMVAKSNSIGVSLFSALTDLIFPKLTSKEYSITYLHGAVTVFNGLLHSYAMTQGDNDDLYRITLELIKPSGLLPTPSTVVPKIPGTDL